MSDEPVWLDDGVEYDGIEAAGSGLWLWIILGGNFGKQDRWKTEDAADGKHRKKLPADHLDGCFLWSSPHLALWIEVNDRDINFALLFPT